MTNCSKTKLSMLLYYNNNFNFFYKENDLQNHKLNIS